MIRRNKFCFYFHHNREKCFRLHGVPAIYYRNTHNLVCLLNERTLLFRCERDLSCFDKISTYSWGITFDVNRQKEFIRTLEKLSEDTECTSGIFNQISFKVKDIRRVGWLFRSFYLQLFRMCFHGYPFLRQMKLLTRMMTSSLLSCRRYCECRCTCIQPNKRKFLISDDFSKRSPGSWRLKR